MRITAPDLSPPAPAWLVRLAGLYLAVRPWVILVAALACFVAGIVASLNTHQWLWFARCGSVLALLGAALGGRVLVRPWWVGKTRQIRDVVVGMIDPDAQRDEVAALLGIIVAGAGTLIWGWGDLLG